MKKIFFLVMLSVLSLSAMAQYAEDTENGIVSLDVICAIPEKYDIGKRPLFVGTSQCQGQLG